MQPAAGQSIEVVYGVTTSGLLSRPDRAEIYPVTAEKIRGHLIAGYAVLVVGVFLLVTFARI